MELPQSYFEPESVEIDSEFIHINDHELKLSDIEMDLEQLVAVLYDDCNGIDRDIVHGLMCQLCEKLDMKIPQLHTLKLK